MVVSLFLVLNFSIGVSASTIYDRQEADAYITISQRLSVKGGSGKYYNADGSPIWSPNRGFDGETVTTTLEPGTMVDRYGYDGGYFISPEGTSYTERALPVGTDKKHIRYLK